MSTTTPVNQNNTNAPYVPSDLEARNYYYGLPSRPRLIARSSPDVWMRPTGPEAYLDPKELTPLGTHPLSAVWEKIVGPAMDLYFRGKGVQWTSMNPLRIGITGQSSPPAVILVGVNPGSLSPELGIEVAVHCRSILVQNGVDDVHVEIRESRFTRTAMMYKPAIYADHAAVIREPFSTSLGLPICYAETTNVEGTGGLFFIDSAKPGILHLLTSRHVLFHDDREENKLYRFRDGTGSSRRDVMLFGEAAFKARLEYIKTAIVGQRSLVGHHKCRLGTMDDEDEDEDVAAERKAEKRKIDEAIKEIEVFEKLLTDVIRDWTTEENRVIGHVVLSPPIGLNGDDGFTEDWVVVEIHPTKIARLNFIGNVIDLASVAVDKLTMWMDPARPSSFMPDDSLLRCVGTVSDQEMFRPDPKNQDHNNDPVTMVLKNGNTSGLTVGRLNTIRAFVREYFKGVAGEMSKEISVLPRCSFYYPFSEPGDSGSVVVDGAGRICGMVTGGDGTTDISDVTLVTSIDFLVKRLAAFGIKANIFPLPSDL